MLADGVQALAWTMRALYLRRRISALKPFGRSVFTASGISWRVATPCLRKLAEVDAALAKFLTASALTAPTVGASKPLHHSPPRGVAA